MQQVYIEDMKEKYDNHEGRCRMLGHGVPFKYCRTVNEGLPCRKVLDCWFELFPVVEFIKSCYTGKEINEFLAPPGPKIESIISLIEKAKK